MSTPLTNLNSNSQFKGYRIRQQVSNEQNEPNNQYLLKILIKNQTNGIPKIRHDVICNGKLYPFIPLFSFTSQQDLGIVEQISTVVLKDENQILCEILSKKVTQIPAARFRQLKKRFQQIFALQLKVDPEELFLVLISEEINDQNEFNCVYDSITQTQFINLMKKIYENCPTRLIPKILRRVTKYLNSTKGRTEKSIEKFKKLLKIIKSTDQTIESQQKIQSLKKLQESPKKLQPKNEQKSIISTKDQSSSQIVRPEEKKQTSQKKVEVKKEQKPAINKPVLSITKQEIQAAKKQSQAKRIEKAKQKKMKQSQKKVQLEKQQLTPQQQNSSDWHDVQNSNDEDQEITNTISKMAFHADDSDEDLKYQAPKKKNKKKNNPIVQLDPQFDSSAGRKNQKLKKQKKNQPSNSPNIDNKMTQKYRKISNESQQNTQDKIVQQQLVDKKTKNQKANRKNGFGNDQSVEKVNKQFTRQKKIDPRILLGINGAPDAIWRQRMRPQKYPRDEDRNQSRGKQNNQTRVIKATPIEQKVPKQTKSKEIKQSKNLTLQKVFSIPEDSINGKEFRFEKRHYNLFVNKLFWVNITDDQVTIQKEGKGYIRRCPVEIIDNGKGIMAEGLTLNIDGLSNLEDGGTSFGDPVFQEFSPQGQWFHISSLDVYAYV